MADLTCAETTNDVVFTRFHAGFTRSTDARRSEQSGPFFRFLQSKGTVNGLAVASPLAERPARSPPRNERHVSPS